MDKLKQIAKEWNALKTDKERWRYVLENKDKIVIMLDDDDTYPMFCDNITPDDRNIWDDLPKLNEFEYWIGNLSGLDDLFSVFSIEIKRV